MELNGCAKKLQDDLPLHLGKRNERPCPNRAGLTGVSGGGRQFSVGCEL